MICRLCMRAIKGRRAYSYLGASVHKACRVKARADVLERKRCMVRGWLGEVLVAGYPLITRIDPSIAGQLTRMLATS